MKNLVLLSVTALTATSGLVVGTMQTASALSWNWNYSGSGIAAKGTFTTNDTPDGFGFYQIVGINGIRNGETITGLQPAGIPIPGNEPFFGDNLISLSNQQLKDGFGYSTANGNYSNPFFATFLPTPGYLEFFSALPIGTNYQDIGPGDTELFINFSATIATVPEPTSILSLFVLGTLGAGSALKRRNSSKFMQENLENIS
jgi:hypothetical protein